MDNSLLMLVGILLLAIVTYLMRASGAILNGRITLSAYTKELFSVAAIIILFSVAMTSTFFDGTELSDLAKIIGVAVAGILAWYKKPFIVIVLSASIVTALLRWLF